MFLYEWQHTLYHELKEVQVMLCPYTKYKRIHAIFQCEAQNTSYHVAIPSTSTIKHMPRSCTKNDYILHYFTLWRAE